MIPPKRPSFAALATLVAGAFVFPAIGQEEVDVEPSVWDLTLGLHAAELPTEQFADYACGTNGGPPSRPIGSWTDYSICPVEAETGWHEVYFQYDDLYEYVARARDDLYRIELYQFTSVYARPVIASALFDDDGFMRGLRLMTDPRVDTATREQAFQLHGFIQARYDGDWQCEQLPTEEGEAAYKGIFVKKVCTMFDPETGVSRRIEANNFRRPGQTVLNADNIPTEGYFESFTRSDEYLVGEIENREERLAEVATIPAVEEDPLVARARDCPGCDLSGAILRRADLRGANLAGANLEGASLHATDLSGANLEGANLRNTNLNRTLMVQINLAGADISGSMMFESRLDGANLAGATLIGVFAGHSRMTSANLTGTIIMDSDLTAVLMSNVTATNASFARSRMWGGQLSRSDFTGAIFARADMLDVIMTGSIAVDTDFRVSNLSGADLRDSDFTRADFSAAVMTAANLARTVLDGAIFEQTRLPGGFTPP